MRNDSIINNCSRISNIFWSTVFWPPQSVLFRISYRIKGLWAHGKITYIMRSEFSDRQDQKDLMFTGIHLIENISSFVQAMTDCVLKCCFTLIPKGNGQGDYWRISLPVWSNGLTCQERAGMQWLLKWSDRVTPCPDPSGRGFKTTQYQVMQNLQMVVAFIIPVGFLL